MLIISAVNIYPTIGWTILSRTNPEALDDKIEQWAQEDEERLGQDIGVFERYKNGIVRWSQFDNSRLIDLGLDLRGGIQMIRRL